MLLRCNNQYYWYHVEHSSSTEKVVDLIREDLRSGWVEDDLRNAAAYRRFNNRRGQWTLRREQCYGEMGWSVAKLPFDEAVLVWHVATDICLHCTQNIDIDISSSPAAGADEVAAVTEISNYMMYLLAFQPNMLMPGARQGLFTAARHEIMHAIRHQGRHQQQLSERDLARCLAGGDDDDEYSTPTTEEQAGAGSRLLERKGGGGGGRHLAHAQRLASAMMKLDAGKRLRVIGGVWVEMICYSASRCSGSLHLKILGVGGGEFLTVVWLLLHRMGMEVLADKLHRPELARDEPDAVVRMMQQLLTLSKEETYIWSQVIGAKFAQEFQKWWEEWQLRVLVLTSLFLQCFLFFSAPFRKHRIPAILRASIWLAYLGSDAVAIYGLAAIFSRHVGAATGDMSSSMLEVLWAPIFLIHLAGAQDSITAYDAAEDNALWARRAVAMSSQAAVAVYVFCRSWSGGKVRARCPVALFVAGFLKMGRTLWALRRASATRIAAVARKTAAADLSISLYLQRASKHAIEATRNRNNIQTNDDEDDDGDERQLDVPHSVLDNQNEFMELFIDFPAPYTRRLSHLWSFLQLEPYDAYCKLFNLVDYAFQIFYTSRNAAYPITGRFIRSIFLVLGMMAMGGIEELDRNKDGFDTNDVKVTYILLWSAFFVEFTNLIPLAHQKWPMCKLAPQMKRTIAQFNLIGFTARSRWSTKMDSDPSRRYSLVRTCQTVLSRIATLLRCNNQHWYYGEHSSWTEKVVDLIREDLRCGWVEDDLRSAAAYRRFNDRRGQWTLWREQCYGEMGWSVAKLPFDEAVLVWHVATDICLHCTEYINISSSPVAGADKITAVMKISNYMMYLLAFQPDMLMPGTRQSLFTAARHEIAHTLRHQGRHQQQLSGRDLVRCLAAGDDDEYSTPATEGQDRAGSRLLKRRGGGGGHLAHARRLAGAMMKLDAGKRLRVIGGVWVEMICYSASRCSGSLHLKSLGVGGGEFLTVVWFLLHWMGMEKLRFGARSLESEAYMEPNLHKNSRKSIGFREEINKLADRLAKEAKSNQPSAPVYVCQNVHFSPGLSQYRMSCK
uniref:DUF4220 domain-containing protein n=1 Tax=Oryza barthii TaxID=65489 RepID=A0A0D3F311_9ORYZ